MKSLILTILLFISIDGIAQKYYDPSKMIKHYKIYFDSTGNKIVEIYYLQDTASKHKRKSKNNVKKRAVN